MFCHAAGVPEWFSACPVRPPLSRGQAGATGGPKPEGLPEASWDVMFCHVFHAGGHALRPFRAWRCRFRPGFPHLPHFREDMPRGQAGLCLRGLPSPVSPRFPACARTGCEDMSGHGVSPFRSRSVPSARRRRDPNSRVSCAGACALGRAFRAGAVCAPDCPGAPPRASRTQGAPRLSVESGAFFAPARTGKGGGPARMPLPSTFAILPWAMRKSSIEHEIFQKIEQGSRLGARPVRCRNSSSPACGRGQGEGPLPR